MNPQPIPPNTLQQKISDLNQQLETIETEIQTLNKAEHQPTIDFIISASKIELGSKIKDICSAINAFNFLATETFPLFDCKILERILNEALREVDTWLEEAWSLSDRALREGDRWNKCQIWVMNEQRKVVLFDRRRSLWLEKTKLLSEALDQQEQKVSASTSLSVQTSSISWDSNSLASTSEPTSGEVMGQNSSSTQTKQSLSANTPEFHQAPSDEVRVRSAELETQHATLAFSNIIHPGLTVAEMMPKIPITQAVSLSSTPQQNLITTSSSPSSSSSSFQPARVERSSLKNSHNTIPGTSGTFYSKNKPLAPTTKQSPKTNNATQNNEIRAQETTVSETFPTENPQQQVQSPAKSTKVPNTNRSKPVCLESSLLLAYENLSQTSRTTTTNTNTNTTTSQSQEEQSTPPPTPNPTTSNPATSTLSEESPLSKALTNFRNAIEDLAHENSALKSSLSTTQLRLHTLQQENRTPEPQTPSPPTPNHTTTASLTQQISDLKSQLSTQSSQLKTLQTKLKLQEPLLKVGISVRLRFLEKVQLLKTHRTSLTITRDTLRTAGKSREIIELGNNAAHRGDFRADLAILGLSFTQPPTKNNKSAEVEAITTFNSVYGINLNRNQVEELIELVFGDEERTEGKIEGEAEKREGKERKAQMVEMLDHRGTIASSITFFASKKVRELEEECLGVLDGRGDAGGVVEEKLVEMRGLVERLVGLERRR